MSRKQAAKHRCSLAALPAVAKKWCNQWNLIAERHVTNIHWFQNGRQSAATKREVKRSNWESRSSKIREANVHHKNKTARKSPWIIFPFSVSFVNIKTQFCPVDDFSCWMGWIGSKWLSAMSSSRSWKSSCPWTRGWNCLCFSSNRTFSYDSWHIKYHEIFHVNIYQKFLQSDQPQFKWFDLIWIPIIFQRTGHGFFSMWRIADIADIASPCHPNVVRASESQRLSPSLGRQQCSPQIRWHNSCEGSWCWWCWCLFFWNLQKQKKSDLWLTGSWIIIIIIIIIMFC